MTSKSLRRLATDHTSLHTAGLPPNYLFAPSKEDCFADLTSLSILLAGPDGTPFVSGVFQLDLNIPTTYPQAPPTAHFRSKIFHPNVDPATGAVCVDTLKRDWKPELTLRDVLVTISCLLVCPNPASALNAEAGQLMEEDFKEYERKAHMWAKMHAAIPASLKTAVEEARNRGDAVESKEGKCQTSKEKRRKHGGTKVHAREIQVENADELPLSTPEISGRGRKSQGLGLEISLDSSMVMDIDTPTQAPPRRRRKVLDSAISTSSDRSQTSKPPDAKRARTSTLQTSPGDRKGQSGTTSSHFFDIAPETSSWHNWINASPDSSEESLSAKKSRVISDHQRLKSAGFCMKRYNSGDFGPRRGIERL